MCIGHQRLFLVLFERIFADNGKRGKILAHPRKTPLYLDRWKRSYFEEYRPKTLHANGKEKKKRKKEKCNRQENGKGLALKRCPETFAATNLAKEDLERFQLILHPLKIHHHQHYIPQDTLTCQSRNISNYSSFPPRCKNMRQHKSEVLIEIEDPRPHAQDWREGL
ncbi:hypothetical protein CEXT_143311 [Caerostris extrusa]|uniref:Uncharacterized protein n=1 Tax=Caerostris extrusa TaxID=172846 RepID=A0AAV4QLI8_CAEEX|nr:hypothetical protein CEXT_143311 [Caerostris extrusa]